MMNPALVQQLAEIARRAEAAPHGQRGKVYQQAAADMGITERTLHNRLKRVHVKKERKQRSDANRIALPQEEAEIIAAYLIESTRKNGKQLSSLENAVTVLRTNNKILAAVIDDTGEYKPLSLSAINRALYAYRLHPTQLLAPKPAIELASLHPNHIWQVDASVSAQYYLDKEGMQALDKKQHYIGKLNNLIKISKQLLIRYVVTDHTSGAIYVEYVEGAESAENLCHCLINAMQQRKNMPFYGVPFKIMTDPGAAMTSGIFRNFCRNMSIDLIINEPGNPRAKGQVENANNIVEREFESGLKFKHVTCLKELNELANKWMFYYNAKAIHNRHKKSRYGAWLLIKPEQLRIAPSVEVCRELAVSAPVKRKVTAKLRVPFNGFEYDVSNVPNIEVKDTILVARNPFKDKDSVHIVLKNAEGRDTFIEAERVIKNDYGFAINAAVIGEKYTQHADTIADKHRKGLEQLITGTNNEKEAKAARKAKQLPFGGTIDPFKHNNEQLPSYLPKQGTELITTIDLPSVVENKLDTVTLATQLKEILGEWSPELMKWLSSNYPQGATQNDVKNIATEIQNIKQRPRLSVVGG